MQQLTSLSLRIRLSWLKVYCIVYSNTFYCIFLDNSTEAARAHCTYLFVIRILDLNSWPLVSFTNWATAPLRLRNWEQGRVGKNLKIWFPHPSDLSIELFVILDPVHMMKLVRNQLEAQELLISNRKLIKIGK